MKYGNIVFLLKFSHISSQIIYFRKCVTTHENNSKLKVKQTGSSDTKHNWD